MIARPNLADHMLRPLSQILVLAFSLSLTLVFVPMCVSLCVRQCEREPDLLCLYVYGNDIKNSDFDDCPLAKSV